MVHLLWWLRACFCRHDWDYAEERYVQRVPAYDRLTGAANPDAGRVCREGIRVSATCKRCGWHRAYWKF